ncbi:uncharacterized protein THITE_2117637 [Thermothielavioides terrestris NRRL 8126]|uniref:DUF1993 domain-containing protein n=1 Tax=Thermothielavioides terrestris (strain ATCC 38088 / NRRL 8126) TaxID=578455 RepID=G2R8F6_THETT|nr:uncharacterized protein THITE_2117637 [Thermothielavioides terrestris NRRL 8126]AEO68214.1 hypothetical protein THITE_2117637 [Thermothielavioides terrestris NRRL 8126]
MSGIDLYNATIGLCNHSLHTLLHIIEKAKAHPDAAELASARLYPDMLPFSFQVIIVSNFAKKTVERLTTPPEPLPVWEDKETTFDELVARINKTLALLATVKREDLVPKEQTVRYTGKFEPVQASTEQYVLTYSIPNILFHVTTAYDILRHKGVDVGKADFLQGFIKDLNLKPAAQ